MPCGSSKSHSTFGEHSDKNGENQYCAFQDLDHSILQHPLHSGVRNVKQILKCLQDATKEVKDIILNECNIIYECRVCASLFRGLANFMYHKRCYCKNHLCEEMVLFDNFEENTVVVQPETPNENTVFETSTVPKLMECTVDLIKEDLKIDKKVHNADTENKTNACKAKQKGKKSNELKKPEHPMVSRRTRDKKTQKRDKDISENEDELNEGRKMNEIIETKEVIKSVEIVEASEKMEIEHSLELSQTERVAKAQKSVLNMSDKLRKDNMDLKDQHKAEMQKLESGIASNIETDELEKKISQNSKVNVTNKELLTSKKELGDRIEASKIGCATEGNIEIIELEDQNLNDSKGSLKEAVTRENFKPGALKVTEINKNNSVSEMIVNKIVKKATAQENSSSTKKLEISSDIPLQPAKKIFFAKHRTIQIKNSVVLDSIRKKLQLKSNIGLNKIGQTAQTVQCFPKIILKTIDGSQHAVFQTTNRKTPEVSNVKSSTDKTENDKLIFLLKKDNLASGKTITLNKNPVKENKNLKPTEFQHMTRRKRLLARNDCNVHELKCLTCNAIFTSLKTLYFHMLSIHSRKRLYYPCPLCKTLFVQMYGVTRHLVSIHNKTKDQINKLRDVIKKKSVWKKVEDMNTSKDGIFTQEKSKEEIKHDVKVEESPVENVYDESDKKSEIKLSKNVSLHQCSKCNRVFGRKSSQVSHEKFCIMNAIKVETVDVTAGTSPISPPLASNVPFSPKKPNLESVSSKPTHQVKPVVSETVINIRPKRRAEKQMHKDFINSQTLKWRSVNRVSSSTKVTPPAVKKKVSKNLEKKISNIMNVTNLTCLKCSRTFSSYSNLKRHVAIHVGWTRFKCIYCEYQAYNKSQCWFHIQKIHNVSEDIIDQCIQDLRYDLLSKNSVVNRPPKSLTCNDVNKSIAIPKLKLSKKKAICVKASNKKPSIIQKDQLENKKEKILEYENEEGLDSKHMPDLKKEKNHLVSILKTNVLDYKKDLTNYKSLTTNNPTTIILSKKLPASSVQSVVTIPTECQLSTIANKASPLRSSPRKADSKSPEEKGITSLITRSTAHTKGSIQIKITPPKPNPTDIIKKPNPTDIVKKSLNLCTEKTFPNKEKLISEWFPKKDINSNTARRESAPLIIGLVPASGSGLRCKSPAITYEKNNT